MSVNILESVYYDETYEVYFLNLDDDINYKDIKIYGKIDSLFIDKDYLNLNLSNLDCKHITYLFQNESYVEEHKLPKNLISLNCNNCNLKKLPDLPITLKILYCSCNKLSNIPIHSNLTYLNCSLNPLTNIPKLNNNLELHFIGKVSHMKYNNINLNKNSCLNIDIPNYGFINSVKDYRTYLMKNRF